RLVGALGNDLLDGGKGVDYFLFTGTLNAKKNVDHIADFSHKQGDEIVVGSAVFAEIGPRLEAGELHRGTKAHDADDRLIYDEARGKLYYDPDGQGGHRQVLFAILDNHAHLQFSDFLLGA